MAYTPELTQNDSAMLRRLAWASCTPMTTTLHEALAFVARSVPCAIVCEHCKDKSHCSDCPFARKNHKSRRET